LWTCGGLTTFWIALGSWVAVFPGTLERLFHVPYDFKDEWGVSRWRFEAFTLGTLGVIVLIAIVGFILGARVREQTVEAPLEAAPVPVS
jgi:hypothetical protein